MTSRLHLPGLLLALLLLVQSHIQAQNDYALEIETVSEDIGMLVGPLGITDLTGYSTTRLYIGNMNPNDFLSSVSGDATNATLVNTTTDFYQATLGAGTPNGINSLLFPVYPDLAYDSWVTIGLEGVPNAGGGEAGVSTVQSGNNPWLTNFDPGAGAAGGNIAIDDAIGGAWYALNGDANGVAGTDMRVLAGQFTTTGELSGQLYIQIFIEGDGADEFRDTFYFGAGAPVLGCTNAEACNYNVDATDDDGSCALPEAGLDCDGNCLADADLDGICDEDEVAGCDDNTACNFNAAATDNDGSCTYADAGLDCDGNCLADADLDGVCDEDEVDGCTDPTASNFDPEATDDDGSCAYACGPDWGEPNTYPGVATVLALVTVEGENVGMMDAVGAYVGDELRGASAIIEFEGATYVNMTVYISGGEEDVTFVLFNQEECITCSMDGGVTAMSFGEYGSFESPLMFDANCSATSLTVDLSEGWNYVSTNLIPNDYAIATLLDDALNGTLLKALGDANFALGNSYTPGIPSVFNSLQSHSDAAGYVIKVNAAGTWTSQGLPLEANNTPLDLNEGWNIIGYVPQVAMSVEAALASINGSVGTVIDGQNGTVWNPANPNEFNSLLNLEPGRSYWLRMLEANTLTYPSAEDIDTNGLGVTPQEEESTAAGTTGWEVSRGPLASAVAAEIRLDDQAVSGEAYIGAFVADLCVAMRPLISTNNLTAVQLAVMLEESADVTFKLWRDGEVFTSSDILSLGGGEEMGQGGDIMPIVRFTSTTNGVWSPDVISALTISPVPASTEAWLDLNVNQDGQMHIGILDARGAEVAILHNGNLPAGQHRLSISVEGWAAGTYFVKGVSPIGVFRSPFIVQ
jgi:hypothetical protein